MYAAIANGGSVLTPRVGSSVVDPATGRHEAVVAGPRRAAPLTRQVDAYLRSALVDTVQRGSTRYLFGAMKDWPVAGKTGTAEVSGKKNTSWFVSYAPANRPRWVVSVVIAQGGPGANTAGRVGQAVHLTLRGLP